MNKILVYKWGSISELPFCEALDALHINHVEFAREMNNFHYDALFAEELIKILHKEKINGVFSYNYFPLISMICEINKIPYVTWIYDCPVRTLQSKTLASEYNYIFCFDRKYTEYLTELGAKNCVHYPLAGDCHMLKRAEAKLAERKEEYACEVSFIGSLYNGTNNRFRSGAFSETTHVWIEKVLREQIMNYNENIIAPKFSEEDEIVEEINQVCGLFLGPEYILDKARFAENVLRVELAARERELYIKSLSEQFWVDLYTSSEIPDRLRNANIKIKGYVDYDTVLPNIYSESRINLNITSRTIETGIPQRIFDILACGGFCLTNYQKEVAEYFEDGKDLVMFYDEKDLNEKVAYYLENDMERQNIAINGYKKVIENFELKKRVRGMLEYIK